MYYLVIYNVIIVDHLLGYVKQTETLRKEKK